MERYRQSSPNTPVKIPILLSELSFPHIEIPKMSLKQYITSVETTLTTSLVSPAKNSPGDLYKRCWQRNHNPCFSSFFQCIFSDEINYPTDTEIPRESLYNGSLQNLQYGSTLTNLPPTTTKGVIHIFIDYSNITAGFVGENPIDPTGLARFLQRDRVCETKQITGSFPDVKHPIWELWRNNGYRTRVTGKGKEIFVDDSIHAQILRLLIREPNPGETIVMVTGDGNHNDGYTSFIECASTAAKRGWKVEICSWRDRLSKNYFRLSESFPSLVDIIYLDRAKGTILCTFPS